MTTGTCKCPGCDHTFSSRYYTAECPQCTFTFQNPCYQNKGSTPSQVGSPGSLRTNLNNQGVPDEILLSWGIVAAGVVILLISTFYETETIRGAQNRLCGFIAAPTLILSGLILRLTHFVRIK